MFNIAFEPRAIMADCYGTASVIVLVIIILMIYDHFNKKQSNFVLYQPTCQGIDPSQCTGLTSGNMPVIDSTSYDWFRSIEMCDGALGVPPSY